MIEPHVALPAIIAAILLERRVRLSVGIGALAIALFMLISNHQLLYEYVARVLPEHAAAEIANILQYSFSSLLFRFGIAPRLAIILGAAQYAALSLVGLWIATRFKRAGESWSVVLVPAAASTIGGTYIHLSQIAVCLPVALLVYQRTRGLLAFGCTIALTIPFLYVLAEPIWTLSTVAAACVVLQLRCEIRPTRLIILGLFSMLMLIAGHRWFVASNIWMLRPAAIATPEKRVLADYGWGAYTTSAHVPALWWVDHLVVLAVLATLVFELIRYANSCSRSDFLTATPILGASPT